ncbi:heavy metal translocating P-type ATPase [Muricauda oceani]|uniref:Heavy metal translocating P-type ATPase n=1 Tax=Flagellimonas oceani TaxID=2698672 RepID=A0A6G7J5L7_9FLAO|nr:heavy-metal-associated domain-containing protein [Allomuricauda oceani]MBW8244468.1 heavy metal translocating P-type ATPase [Allomuricauda oceani]QII45878.1 heavy metal translocating P-type ATPase [Allomuricauda oceani]
MQHTYSIEGMTCGGCASSVEEQLAKVDGVQDVQVNLEKAEANITMSQHISLEKLKAALSEKYTIGTKEEHRVQANVPAEKSKFEQLKPLFLIFGYLFAAALLLNYRDWDYASAMLDFMGLFYIVFSFFKFLDLKGFPQSFSMYDPLAKAVPVYGKIYPFLELALGLLFLMRFQIPLALILTIVILGITTYGVTKSLLDKKSIRCACLGTALNLPMTEATFIENAIMLVMALLMLFLF